MNDTISRSALISELEAFKMSLGDIVLRYVVDRVIDLVKEYQSPTVKTCENCKHYECWFDKHPCVTCIYDVTNRPSRWEEKT